LVLEHILLTLRTLLLVLSAVVDSIESVRVSTFGALFGIRVEKSYTVEAPESSTLTVDILAATDLLCVALAFRTLF